MEQLPSSIECPPASGASIYSPASMGTCSTAALPTVHNTAINTFSRSNFTHKVSPLDFSSSPLSSASAPIPTSTSQTIQIHETTSMPDNSNNHNDHNSASTEDQRRAALLQASNSSRASQGHPVPTSRDLLPSHHLTDLRPSAAVVDLPTLAPPLPPQQPWVLGEESPGETTTAFSSGSPTTRVRNDGVCLAQHRTAPSSSLLVSSSSSCAVHTRGEATVSLPACLLLPRRRPTSRTPEAESCVSPFHSVCSARSPPPSLNTCFLMDGNCASPPWSTAEEGGTTPTDPSARQPPPCSFLPPPHVVSDSSCAEEDEFRQDLRAWGTEGGVVEAVTREGASSRTGNISSSKGGGAPICPVTPGTPPGSSFIRRSITSVEEQEKHVVDRTGVQNEAMHNNSNPASGAPLHPKRLSPLTGSTSICNFQRASYVFPDSSSTSWGFSSSADTGCQRGDLPPHRRLSLVKPASTTTASAPSRVSLLPSPLASLHGAGSPSTIVPPMDVSFTVCGVDLVLPSRLPVEDGPENSGSASPTSPTLYPPDAHGERSRPLAIPTYSNTNTEKSRTPTLARSPKQTSVQTALFPGAPTSPPPLRLPPSPHPPSWSHHPHPFFLHASGSCGAEDRKKDESSTTAEVSQPGPNGAEQPWLQVAMAKESVAGEKMIEHPPLPFLSLQEKERPTSRPEDCAPWGRTEAVHRKGSDLHSGDRPSSLRKDGRPTSTAAARDKDHQIIEWMEDPRAASLSSLVLLHETSPLPTEPPHTERTSGSGSGNSSVKGFCSPITPNHSNSPKCFAEGIILSTPLGDPNQSFSKDDAATHSRWRRNSQTVLSRISLLLPSFRRSQDSAKGSSTRSASRRHHRKFSSHWGRHTHQRTPRSLVFPVTALSSAIAASEDRADAQVVSGPLSCFPLLRSSMGSRSTSHTTTTTNSTTMQLAQSFLASSSHPMSSYGVLQSSGSHTATLGASHVGSPLKVPSSSASSVKRFHSSTAVSMVVENSSSASEGFSNHTVDGSCAIPRPPLTPTQPSSHDSRAAGTSHSPRLLLVPCSAAQPFQQPRAAPPHSSRLPTPLQRPHGRSARKVYSGFRSIFLSPLSVDGTEKLNERCSDDDNAALNGRSLELVQPLRFAVGMNRSDSGEDSSTPVLQVRTGHRVVRSREPPFTTAAPQGIHAGAVLKREEPPRLPVCSSVSDSEKRLLEEQMSLLGEEDSERFLDHLGAVLRPQHWQPPKHSYNVPRRSPSRPPPPTYSPFTLVGGACYRQPTLRVNGVQFVHSSTSCGSPVCTRLDTLPYTPPASP